MTRTKPVKFSALVNKLQLITKHFFQTIAVIITHIFHVKFIPNFLARQVICQIVVHVTIYFFTIITIFVITKLFHILLSFKNIFIRQSFLINSFNTVHILIRITSFSFKSSKFLKTTSSVKYLKSLSEKILTNFSRLVFISCIPSMKTKF